MAKLCVILCLFMCVDYGLCQFGFFQQIGDTTNQFGQSVIRTPKSLRDRLVGILRPNSDKSNTNRGFIFPFNQRPGNDNANNQRNQYDNQNNFNNGNYNPYNDRNTGNPVVFPTSRPENGNLQNEYASEAIPIDAQNTYNNQDDGKIPEADTPSSESPYIQAQSNNNPNQDNPIPTSLPQFEEHVNGESMDPAVQNGPESNGAVNFVTSTSTLPPLTPVPAAEGRSNVNFGDREIFTETCEKIEGLVGSCISLYQCPSYLQYIKENRNDPAAVQLLRKVHCGFDGNNPKVCCPRQGIPTALPTEPTTAITTTSTTTVATPAAKSLDDGDFITAMPEPPVCGLSNASFSRVVGGVDAKLGDFPWVAVLGFKSRRGQGVLWQCGGSLVSSKHVLTAAHCIHGHEKTLYLVRLGELDLAKEDDGASPVDVLIKKMIKHEDYSANVHINDIGILVLERDVEFTSLIRPICLPKEPELRSKSFENYNPIIAGWGDTTYQGKAATHLQALQLPVLANSFCNTAYSKYKTVIDDRVLCAGFKQGGKDACQGDSGGPLMQPIWDSKVYTTYFYQIGVVSYGRKCAEAGFPGVYARVTHYVPWIQEKMLGA